MLGGCKNRRHHPALVRGVFSRRRLAPAAKRAGGVSWAVEIAGHLGARGRRQRSGRSTMSAC